MNTQTQRPKITTKKYQCLVCKTTEMHSTNHFGDIYCACKNCGNTGLSCIEPEAIAKRENTPTITTKLHVYTFDVSIPEQKREYIKLCKELEDKGYELFDCRSQTKWNYFDLLPSEVKIEIDYVFNNQWNSDAGRLMDWYEEIYDNKNLKRGYWLELTEAHKKSREPKEYDCITLYDGKVIGKDIINAINTSEASNALFNKYFKEGMDIWKYSNTINLVSHD